MRVIIALDHSECSQFALKSAVSRPWPESSSIKIVHVLEPFDPINSAANAAQWSTWVETINTERRSSAQDLLDNAVIALKNRHNRINVTRKLLEAALPDKVITEIAKRWSADVIIMGSHDHRGLKRLLLGSTAMSVLQKTICSVEIIKSQCPSTSEQYNVLVALDQSTCSSSLFNTILSYPWSENTVFKILSVARPEDEKHMATDVDEKKASQLEFDLALKAQMLDSRMKSPCSASFEVVAAENPKKDILRRIEDWPAHLVIVGSHSHVKSGFRKRFLGSVSHAIALDAPCSVAVIKTLESQ